VFPARQPTGVDCAEQTYRGAPQPGFNHPTTRELAPSLLLSFIDEERVLEHRRPPPITTQATNSPLQNPSKMAKGLANNGKLEENETVSICQFLGKFKK
jgi:hypothetical protein